ncbi:MAG TPA: hypothetical protein VHI99_14480 [Vicinamibacterales bacterium]|nr:hypothetical protein [Vicinamibacterales bacterium]
MSSVVSLLHSLRFLFRSRASLHLEIIGLRHQRSYRTPSHWQNAYVERVIGSIQRVRLDRVIVLNATGLHWILRDYIAYYMRARTDLALDKDTPCPRARLHGRQSVALSPLRKSAGGITVRPHRRVAIARRRFQQHQTVPPVRSTGICSGELPPTFTISRAVVGVP